MKREVKNDHADADGKQMSNVVAFGGKRKDVQEGVDMEDANGLIQEDFDLVPNADEVKAVRSKVGVRFHLGRYRIFGHYVHATFLVLAFLEFVVFTGAAYLAAMIDQYVIADVDLAISLPRSMLAAGLLVVFLATMGLYATHQRERIEGLLLRLSVAFGLWIVCLGVLYSAFPSLVVWNGTLSTEVVICLLSTLLLRAVFANMLEKNVAMKRVLVIGAGRKALEIEKLRRKADRRGFELIGFVNPFAGQEPRVKAGSVVALKKGLCDFVLNNQVDEIVIAEESRQSHRYSKELLECRMGGVGIVPLVDFLEREIGKIQVELLDPSWLLHAKGFTYSWSRAVSKRIFDVVSSLLMLVVCSPIIVFAALVIWLDCGGKGSVLYRQQRVGENGETFDLYKFRSMRTDAEKDGKARWAAKNDPRITRSGGFIRKYRIDEIPQLWNILRGDMSLVGPRPERPEFVRELNTLTPFYSERHRVKPGLAGWAQLRFPYGSSEEDSIEKLKFDLFYVKNNNVLFDVLILIQTLEVVVFGQGAR